MPLTTLAFGVLYAALRRESSDGADAAPPEPRLCGQMARVAGPLGILLYFFCPDDYDPATGQLRGHCFSLPERRWIRRPVPLPDIVYDRRFPRTPAERARCAETMELIRERQHYQWLGGSLPSKLRVYESLRDDPALAGHLPPASVYRSLPQLAAMLGRFPEGVVLKPAAGMQGRGLLRLKQEPLESAISVNGRTRGNRPFAHVFRSRDSLAGWLDKFTGSSAFVVQPYLSLSDADDRPYDIRVLLQKDETGQWMPTGAVARIGRRHGLTSNLHGGGEARPAGAWLAANLGGSTAERLLSQLHTISGNTARRLEERFGRFAELAFDYGIDRGGKPWLLEANAKPGRDAFRLIKDDEAKRLSALRPLQYARYLAGRSTPTFTANHSATGLCSRPAIPPRHQAAALNVQEVHR